eukprot:748618-Hanusia_phi.AAC.2
MNAGNRICSYGGVSLPSELELWEQWVRKRQPAPIPSFLASSSTFPLSSFIPPPLFSFVPLVVDSSPQSSYIAHHSRLSIPPVTAVLADMFEEEDKVRATHTLACGFTVEQGKASGLVGFFAGLGAVFGALVSSNPSPPFSFSSLPLLPLYFPSLLLDPPPPFLPFSLPIFILSASFDLLFISYPSDPCFLILCLRP